MDTNPLFTPTGREYMCKRLAEAQGTVNPSAEAEFSTDGRTIFVHGKDISDAEAINKLVQISAISLSI